MQLTLDLIEVDGGPNSNGHAIDQTANVLAFELVVDDLFRLAEQDDRDLRGGDLARFRWFDQVEIDMA